MMNKKALSPAWISSKELEVPLAQMVSINFSSKEDFFEHFLDISTKTRDLKKDFKIRNEIEKRFHKIDGKANPYTISKLKSRIQQFPYWKNRFEEFNLNIEDVSLDNIKPDLIEKYIYQIPLA